MLVYTNGFYNDHAQKYLHERLSNQKNDFKIRKTEAFALGRHFIDNGQIFDFQNAKIIASENSFYKRAVLEMLNIVRDNKY